MKAIATDLGAAALGGFVLVLPLAILELVNTTVTRQDVPGFFALFGFLWLLPMAVLVVLMAIVRDVRAGSSPMAHPLKLVLSVAVVLVLATMWGSLVADQMSCFLGVPNCD
jgi:uncharacterized membrane protein